MVSELLTIGRISSRYCQLRVSRLMHSVTSSPITAAVFAALTLLLSGCIAFDTVGRMEQTGAILVSAQGELSVDR